MMESTNSVESQEPLAALPGVPADLPELAVVEELWLTMETSCRASKTEDYVAENMNSFQQ